MKTFLVPGMLILSSLLMATAWLGHLRYKETWSFWMALGVSWMLVLPEYFLNTAATRLGHGHWSGAQMAAMNLASGVVCISLFSSIALKETLSWQQWAGFGLMLVSIFLIVSD